MRQRLGKDDGSILCTAAVFDHALLQPSIHQWLFRRWTTFNICTQCATACAISYFLGRALHIRPTWEWGLTIGALMGLFVWQAIASWKEIHSMFDFVVDLDRVIRDRPKRQSAYLG
jgi:hypothetical protein